MIRKAVFIMLTLALGLPSGLSAQENDGADIVVPSGDDIIETIAYDDAEGGGGGGLDGLTSGTTEVITPRTACYVGYDSYRERWRLALGYAFGRYTTSGRSAAANASFDGAPCSLAADSGSITFGDDLEFFLSSANHFDETNSDGGKTYYRLRMTYYCTGGCNGTCYDYTDLTDTASCTSTSGDVTWKEALDLEGDGDACHRPDLVITSASSWYPANRTATSGYEFKVETYVCDSDGTGCTYYYDVGCVDVTFD